MPGVLQKPLQDSCPGKRPSPKGQVHLEKSWLHKSRSLRPSVWRTEACPRCLEGDPLLIGRPVAPDRQGVWPGIGVHVKVSGPVWLLSC